MNNKHRMFDEVSTFNELALARVLPVNSNGVRNPKLAWERFSTSATPTENNTPQTPHRQPPRFAVHRLSKVALKAVVALLMLPIFIVHDLTCKLAHRTIRWLREG